MSFGSILREIVDECGGGLGAALMGADGIPIEEVEALGAGACPIEGGITTAGVEFGHVLQDLRKASDGVGGGAVTEAVVVLPRFTLVFRPLDEETFLLVALRPDGNLGKARYLIRRHVLALRQEL